MVQIPAGMIAKEGLVTGLLDNLVTVVFSGRPLVVGEVVELSRAVLMCFMEMWYRRADFPCPYREVLAVIQKTGRLFSWYRIAKTRKKSYTVKVVANCRRIM